jgi:hypothetical protein
MALFKHINHYGPSSGFLYYSLTIPYREDTPYLPPGDMLGSSMGFALGTVRPQHPVLRTTDR